VSGKAIFVAALPCKIRLSTSIISILWLAQNLVNVQEVLPAAYQNINLYITAPKCVPGIGQGGSKTPA
jgi:hypothetical protein